MEQEEEEEENAKKRPLSGKCLFPARASLFSAM
jgi:hypothetical protein